MSAPRSDCKWPLRATLVVVGILLFWLVFSVFHRMDPSDVEQANGGVPFYLMADKELHPVVIHTPTGPPHAVVGQDSQTGEPITASCTTCHNTRTPEPAHGLTQDLNDFHQGLVFEHGPGTLSCLSCHNPDDYDTLRAANGNAIQYQKVISLCAQCHSSQHEDYVHGAHGGMNGHWDLSQGPRSRHSCIDCHDPHAPAFPQMQPTFKPIDRGLNDSPHDPKQGAGHE